MLIGRALRMLPRRHNEARKVVGCTSTVEPRSHRRAAIAPEAALRSQHVTFEGTSDGPTRCHSAQSADRHSWMSACADDPWSATRERIGRTALTGRCRRRESIRSNRVRGPIRCSRWTRPNRCSRSTARSRYDLVALALPSVDAPYGPTVEGSFTDEHTAPERERNSFVGSPRTDPHPARSPIPGSAPQRARVPCPAVSRTPSLSLSVMVTRAAYPTCQAGRRAPFRTRTGRAPPSRHQDTQ